MTVLIVGATGATGRLLTEELLNRGHRVRAVVRHTDSFPEAVPGNRNLEIIKASVLDISQEEMRSHLKGCDAVASCLGHNITFKGVFGKPRKLVRDTVRLLCGALEENSKEKPVKFVFMSTSGYRNPGLSEKISTGETIVTGLIRALVPPYSDSEEAADHLRLKIGSNHSSIEWAAVRPDSLIDNKAVTPYKLYPSPVRSVIFNPGKTSRINVAHFMAELIDNGEVWSEWKGQTPVIYNTDSLT